MAHESDCGKSWSGAESASIIGLADMVLRLKDMLIEMSLGTVRLSPSQMTISQVFLLPAPHFPVQLFPSECRLHYILDEEGEVWQAEESLLVPLEKPKGVKVRQLACSGDVLLLATTEGVVYVKGQDREGSGVMGGLEECMEFVKLQGLDEVSISQVAMSSSHCAALDRTSHTDTGQLWTWGSGSQLGRSSPIRLPPAPVPSARAFTGKKLACSQTLTALTTTGGFLYLYGEIGGHEKGIRPSLRFCREGIGSNQTSKPILLPGLREKYVENAVVGNNLIVALTDLGEVYLSDACLDLVRLPTETGTKIANIGVLDEGVYGQAEGLEVLYLWEKPEREENKTFSPACGLNSWTGRLFGSLISFSVVPAPTLCIYTAHPLTPSQSFASPLASLSPYRHSHYIDSLEHRVYGRLDRWNELQSNSPLLPCQAGLIRLSDAVQRCLKRYGCMVLKQCPARVQGNRPRYARLVGKLDALRSRYIDAIRRSYILHWRFQPVRLDFKTSGAQAVALSLKKAILRCAFTHIQGYISLRKEQRTRLRPLLAQRSRIRTVLAAFYSRWKTISLQMRMRKAGRINAKSLGARTLTGRLKALLRKQVWREVATVLQTADFSRFRLQAELVLLEMRVEKVRRRLCNWAFNRIYSKCSGLHQAKQALELLQALSGIRLKYVLRDLCRTREIPHIAARKVLDLVWICRKYYHQCLRKAWKALKTTPQLEVWSLFPGKASLKIPTMSLSASNVQSPQTSKGHRVSESLRTLPPKISRPLQTKPPWKRPSAAAPFDLKSPLFSPKSRRADYVEILKQRTSKDRPKSLQGTCCPSPDLVLFDSEWSGSPPFKPDSAETTDVSVQLSADSYKPASQDRSQDLEREWKHRALRTGLTHLQMTFQIVTEKAGLREAVKRLRQLD